MQVRHIHGNGFMGYDDFSLDLPERGLVLITGENGAGKSAVIEAVSYACWGKTLRGSDPRREGEAGSIRLGVTGFDLERSWTGNPPRVKLNTFDGQTFDTMTKGQDFVTERLGEWDTWRRSCAFSSSDDLSFASTSDSERKRLLENLLGLQRFDVASARVREDLREASSTLARARGAAQVALAESNAAQRNLGAMEAMVTAAAPAAGSSTDNVSGRLELLKKWLPDRQASYQHEADQHQARVANLATWQERHRHLKAELRAAEQGSACPTCGQDWPDQEAREAAKAALLVKLDALMEQEPRVGDRVAHDAALKSLNDCRNGITELANQLSASIRQEKARADQLAVVQKARERLLDAIEVTESLELEVATADKRDQLLSSVDAVLGTRGARAHMLSGALSGLEQAANVWLDRVARADRPLSLRLSPYTEKKTGGIADAITLEIEGAGGGRGYRAASGGEKRRIDVALMLALAEIAQVSNGGAAQTMFMDEVFDALDAPGVEAVSEALDLLAHDRCVVIVSHNLELINRLTPVRRFHARDGVIGGH